MEGLAAEEERRAEDARRREREVSEAKERELNEVKGLAQRATVSERLKRHAEREVLELTRELETLRASTAAEREVGAKSKGSPTVFSGEDGRVRVRLPGADAAGFPPAAAWAGSPGRGGECRMRSAGGRP